MGAAEGRGQQLISKHARVEWERRFVIADFPLEANVIRVRRITDRYITGTNLRLREMTESEREPVFKLTQKVPEQSSGARQELITSIYLTQQEFRLLAQLPAGTLTKTRHSVPPFGIDVFEGELSGLVLAEAEFDSAVEASKLAIPPYVVHEVTNDRRFSGGSLVSASRTELLNWLAEYGIKVDRAAERLLPDEADKVQV